MVLKSLLLKSNGKLSNAQQNQEDGGRSNGATEPVADDLPRSAPAASKLDTWVLGYLGIGYLATCLGL